MAEYDELVDLIKSLLTEMFYPKPTPHRAVLGDGLGNVVVPGKPDRSFARFDRGSSEFFEIFNRTVEPVHDWPILMGEFPWQPGLNQVIDTDWSAFEQSGWGSSIGDTSPHAPTHEWPDGKPGADPVNVYTRAIVPLRGYTLGTGSTSIYANAYEYDGLGGTGTIWPGLPGLDLAPVMANAVTPSGSARFMGLYLDKDLNTLGLVTGTTDIFTSAQDPPLVDFPIGVLPVARIRVYGGQTFVSEADIRDARRPFTPFSAGGGGASGAWPADSKAMIDTTEYDTIQAAIDAGSAGETVKIGPGEFTEALTADKADMTLVCAGTLGSTKITSSAVGATISVTADNVKLVNLDIEHTGAGVLAVGVAMNTASITTRLERCRATLTGNATASYPIYITNGIAHVRDCIGISQSNNLGYGLFASGGNSEVFVRDGYYEGDDGDIATGISTTVNLSGPRLGNDTLTGINFRGYWAGTADYGPFRVGQGAAVVNQLYNSLMFDCNFQESHLSTDHADDEYFADVWNIVHDASTPNRPSLGRQIAGATDPFTHYLRIQSANTSTYMGLVQFIMAADAKPLRNAAVSLSFDAWGSNITTIRAAVLEWGSTADTLTSDVVGTWAAGNSTLATNWTYASTPSADTTITATRDRYKFENITLTNTFNNLAVFIWTPAAEASGDWLNVARVQLEEGTIATPFQKRQYSTELEICQGFVNKSFTQGVVPGTASVIGVLEIITREAVPASVAGSLRTNFRFPVTMRGTPAVTLYEHTAGTANAVRNATAATIRSGCTAETATLNDGGMPAITVDNTDVDPIALDDLIVYHYVAKYRL